MYAGVGLVDNCISCSILPGLEMPNFNVGDALENMSHVAHPVGALLSSRHLLLIGTGGFGQLWRLP
jgi:hypothetical protein